MISDFDYNLSKQLDQKKTSLSAISCNKKGLIIVSSSDKVCSFFTSNEDGEYQFQKETNLHDDIVQAVKDDALSRGFFTGGKDSLLIFMDNDGIPLGEYTGHQGPITSLSQSEEEPNWFVSGCYDGTAKIWDVESQKLLFELKSHSNEVTCLGLPGKKIITASADRSIHFWDNGKKYFSIEKAHNNTIRSIVISPFSNTFLTCGNDYTIKEWTFDGKLIKTKEGHKGFVSSLSFNQETGQLFSCGEDYVVKLWKSSGEPQQDLLHPHIVWDCAYNPLNGDVLTACDDGIFRVWTYNESKWLIENEIEEYNLNCKSKALTRKERDLKPNINYKPQLSPQQNSIKQEENNNQNVFSNEHHHTCLHHNQHQHNIVNSFENFFSNPQNQHSPFEVEEEDYEEDNDINNHPQIQVLIMSNQLEDGQRIAIMQLGSVKNYQFDIKQRKFFPIKEDINELHQKEKEEVYYKGDEVFPEGMYDTIFSLEYVDNKYGVLPLRLTDNVSLLSEKFSRKYTIPKHSQLLLPILLRQKIDEIKMKKNSLSGSSSFFENMLKATMIRQSMNDLADRNMQMLQQNISNESKVTFPITQFCVFDIINVEGPQKKIVEISELLKNQQGSISSIQLIQIKNVLSVIGNTSEYSTSTFEDSDVNQFKSLLLSWKDDHLLPLFDTYRMILLHPKIDYCFALPEGGVDELNQCLNYVKANTNIKLTILSFRIMCNHFVHYHSRELMKKKREEILTVLNIFVENDNENIRSSMIGLLFNYSILFSDGTDSEAALQIIMLVIDLFRKEKKSEPILTLLKIIGNLICASEANKMMAIEMSLAFIVNAINVKDENEETVEILKLQIILMLR